MKHCLSAILSFFFISGLYAQQNDFSFVIIPDRTGGFRAGVFEDALQKTALLQPDFCIGIGDYVEGYSDDLHVLTKQWNEFDSISGNFKIPFYKAPGNHDYTGDLQKKLWKLRIGEDYRHFVYKNMLFLIMNTNDGDGVNISSTQLSYFNEVIRKNNTVDWTFVIMHHPLWKAGDDKGFYKIQQALKDRRYTVFAGHTHIYDYQKIHGNDYITMATAGGSSRLRGNDFGETDHVAFVTIKNKKPIVTQLKLSSILAKNFTDEKRVHAANAVDALGKLHVAVLTNDHQEGGMYFSFKNPTPHPVDYSIRFFNNPGLHIAKGRIDLHVLPGEERNEYVAVKRLATPGTDTIAFKFSVTSQLSGKDSLRSERESFVVFKENSPLLTPDTVYYFLEKAKIDIPLKTGITLQYSSENAFNDYTLPLVVEKTGKIGIRLYDNQSGAVSLPQYIYLNKMPLLPAAEVDVKKLSKGLRYSYYEGVFSTIPDFKKLKHLSTGISNNLDVKKIMQRDHNFAIQFTGYMHIPQDGLYQLLLRSDDGSKMFIHDTCVVDNDGSHSAKTQSGFIALKKGFHPVRIDYFEDFDGEELSVQLINQKGEEALPVKFYHLPR